MHFHLYFAEKDDVDSKSKKQDGAQLRLTRGVGAERRAVCSKQGQPSEWGWAPGREERTDVLREKTLSLQGG